MDSAFKLKCILHSAKCRLEDERRDLELSKFHQVKASQHRERYEELMRAAREIMPDVSDVSIDDGLQND